MNEKLTVYFEDPFWVGVFERIYDGKLSVCKVTFGAEPKDYDVRDYILRQFYRLKFSPTVEFELKQTADNPKRRQRNKDGAFRILSNDVAEQELKLPPVAYTK